MRKKVILLTATPVSNDLFDLYNQFTLVTQGDRRLSAAAASAGCRRAIAEDHYTEHFLQAWREAPRLGCPVLPYSTCWRKS